VGSNPTPSATERTLCCDLDIRCDLVGDFWREPVGGCYESGIYPVRGIADLFVDFRRADRCRDPTQVTANLV
jgi:hypothetical protein